MLSGHAKTTPHDPRDCVGEDCRAYIPVESRGSQERGIAVVELGEPSIDLALEIIWHERGAGLALGDEPDQLVDRIEPVRHLGSAPQTLRVVTDASVGDVATPRGKRAFASTLIGRT